jgi:hypothetical protein
MKKVLSVLAALALISGSATCFGAAAVNLNNYDVNNFNGYPVFYLTSGTAADAGCFVEILGGASASSLTPIASTTNGKNVFALAAGFFDGGIGNLDTVTVADNATASFRAIAWKGTGGVDDWKTATEVVSVDWTQQTGANTPPSLPSPATLQFPSGMVIPVPEPTIMVLGLLGAAGLLIRRRK